MTNHRNPGTMSLLFILGIFLLPATCLPMKETEKTITKEVSVSPTTLIRFENKEGPLTVETWDKNQVKLVTRVVIDGKEADVQKVIDHLTGISFTSEQGAVRMTTRYYSHFSETFPGGIKIILSNGDIIRGITKIETSYTLTVPKGNPLDLTQKYEKVVLPDLTAQVQLNLYDCDLEAGSIGGKATISMKYSSGTLNTLQETSMTLYESHVEAASVQGLALTSKYSEVNLREAGELVIDSYEDKLSVSKHRDVKAKAKYTSLRLADFTTGTFDLYECKLEAGTIDNLTVKAKYSIFSLTSVRSVSFTDAYEIKFLSGIVGTLSGSSKYGTFDIGLLDNSLSLTTSYEDDITIKRMGPKFTEVSLTAKYSDLDITFDTGAKYLVEATLQYTDLSFPESSFRELRYHKDGSNFQYRGIVKGGVEETCPAVRLTMYEGAVTLR